MKAYLPQGQQYKVIHIEVLGPRTQISQMKLTNQNSDGKIFIATNNGIYGVPVSNCSSYSDCCSCIAARDPYCAYDTSSLTCASVAMVSEGIQDLSGNVNICPYDCDAPVSTTEPTSQTTELGTPAGCVEVTERSTTESIDVTFGLGE